MPIIPRVDLILVGRTEPQYLLDVDSSDLKVLRALADRNSGSHTFTANGDTITVNGAQLQMVRVNDEGSGSDDDFPDYLHRAKR